MTPRRNDSAVGDAMVTPQPSDDGEVAAIVAAVRFVLQRTEAPRAVSARSGWRFAGRWWR